MGGRHGDEEKKHIIRGSVALLLCMFLVVSFAMPVSVLGWARSKIRDFKVNLFDYDQDDILDVLENMFTDFGGSPVEEAKATETLTVEKTEVSEDFAVEWDHESEDLFMDETESIRSEEETESENFEDVDIDRFTET